VTAAVRERPALFRALGKSDPPPTIILDGLPLERLDVFKHDSWAATARYRGGGRDVVCKFNRVQYIFGLPMAWVGRWLACREAAAFRQLAGLEGIPTLCGDVYDEDRRLANAVAHDYVPGHPLAPRERPDDDFFPRLLRLVEVVHGRAVAYVDLHKRENVIVGDDGRPWLVDFQVCFRLPPGWRGGLSGAILRTLQRADRYHLAKHVRRHRPDQLAAVAVPGGEQRPWWVKAHRVVAVPLRQLRRSLLTWLRIRAKGGRATSEAFAEDAFRRAV
jgi:hypothetical protein